MFRTDLLYIIRSLDTVITAIVICHTGYADCAASEVADPASSTVSITSITNNNCCDYSIKTSDDGQ
jgi:hypothetical protein